MTEDQMTDTDASLHTDEKSPEPEGHSQAEALVVEEGWHIPHPSSNSFATLVVKRAGAETDIAFPLSPPAVIGRFDPGVGPIDVDLASLPEGAYVSRKHAKISRDDEGWKISDLGSSNGTFVLKDDFEKVTEAPLEDGTEVALGNARFVFHLRQAED